MLFVWRVNDADDFFLITRKIVDDIFKFSSNFRLQDIFWISLTYFALRCKSIISRNFISYHLAIEFSIFIFYATEH